MDKTIDAYASLIEATAVVSGNLFLWLLELTASLADIHWILAVPTGFLALVITIIVLKFGLLIVIKLAILGFLVAIIVGSGFELKTSKEAERKGYSADEYQKLMQPFIPMDDPHKVAAGAANLRNAGRSGEAEELIRNFIEHYHNVCSFPRTRIKDKCHNLMVASILFADALSNDDWTENGLPSVRKNRLRRDLPFIEPDPPSWFWRLLS
jgi:hypothetical protein